MDIDVIIPVYRPGKELFSLLDKLESQSLPIHEIILMNTEEKFLCELVGDYADFRKKYPNVQVHHLRRNSTMGTPDAEGWNIPWERCFCA